MGLALLLLLPTNMSWQKKRFRGKISRARLYAEDGNKCAYCLLDLRNVPARMVTLDHIVPRNFGGTNAVTNLLTCCLSCNSRRRDMVIQDFCGVETLVRLVRDYPRVSTTIVAQLTTVDWLNVTRRIAR